VAGPLRAAAARAALGGAAPSAGAVALAGAVSRGLTLPRRAAALALLLTAVALGAWGTAALRPAASPPPAELIAPDLVFAPAPDQLSPADLLREARERADKIKDADLRAAALQGIAEAQLRSGDKAAARRTLRDIADGLPKGESATLDHIPRLQVQVGDEEEARKNAAEALRRAREYKDVGYRAARLSYVAETLVLIGERDRGRKAFEEAADAAWSLKEMLLRDETLFSVAVLQVRCGEYEGARKVAGSFNAIHFREYVLGAIARHQAESGDLKAALETAKDVAGGGAGLRRQLVEGLARRGSLKEAAAQAESIAEPFDRAYAFMAIAAAQAERGDAKGALASVARSRKDVRLDDGPQPGQKFSWSSDLPGTVGIQARAGDVDGALKAAREIASPAYRALALATVVPHQAARDRAGARRTADEAAKALEQAAEHQTWDRNLARPFVYGARARVGDAAAAVRAAGEIKEGPERQRLLEQIARSQAAGGDARGARDWVRGAGVEDEFERARLLVAVAEGMLDRAGETRTRN
jgi:hypothetical protein